MGEAAFPADPSLCPWEKASRGQRAAIDRLSKGRRRQRGLPGAAGCPSPFSSVIRSSRREGREVTHGVGLLTLSLARTPWRNALQAAAPLQLPAEPRSPATSAALAWVGVCLLGDLFFSSPAGKQCQRVNLAWEHWENRLFHVIGSHCSASGAPSQVFGIPCSEAGLPSVLLADRGIQFLILGALRTFPLASSLAASRALLILMQTT